MPYSFLVQVGEAVRTKGWPNDSIFFIWVRPTASWLAAVLEIQHRDPFKDSTTKYLTYYFRWRVRFYQLPKLYPY